MAPLLLARLTSGRMQHWQCSRAMCPTQLPAPCSSIKAISAPGHGGRHALRAVGSSSAPQRDSLRCSCTATESETTTTTHKTPPSSPSSSNPPAPTTSDPASVPRIKRTMAGLDSLLGIQEEDKETAKAKDSAAAASSSTPGSTDLDQPASSTKKPATPGSPDVEDHIQKIIEKARKLADEQSTKGPSASSELDQAALKREFETYLNTLVKPQGALSKDDIKALKDAAFGPLTFWVTETLPIQEESRTGLLIRGNLRDDRDKVFQNLCAKVAELFKGKYEVFMVEDTEAEDDAAAAGARSMPGAPSTSVGASRGLITGPRVAFQIVPAAQAQPPQTDTLQRAAAFILALLVIVSSLELALTSNISSLPKDVLEYFSNPNNLNGDEVPAAIQNWDPSAYVETALPIAGALLGVNLAHETGHRVAALLKGVQLGPSFFIPFGEIGSLGAITPFTSLLKNRLQLWDVAVAGPLAGAVVASGLLLLGLAQSAGLDPADTATASTFVTVPTQLFQGSLLLGGIARGILGEQALRGSVVLVSPFVVAGWCGLITTALNMLPVGSLDGGRMVQATYGRKALDLTGFFTYLGLGLGLLGSSLALPFGLYVIITQRTCEKYIQDNVAPAGSARMTATAIAVLTAVMILVPMAPELADAFGVGSTAVL